METAVNRVNNDVKVLQLPVTAEQKEQLSPLKRGPFPSEARTQAGKRKEARDSSPKG